VVGRLLSIDFSLSFFGDFQKYRAYTAQNARYFFSTGVGLLGGDRDGRPYISFEV
jgi:hypothetical protein